MANTLCVLAFTLSGVLAVLTRVGIVGRVVACEGGVVSPVLLTHQLFAPKLQVPSNTD